jgi:DNA-binding Lrp family transcriptional regulator
LCYKKSYKDIGQNKAKVNELTFKAKCFEDVHEIIGVKVDPGKEQEIVKVLGKFPQVAAVYKSLGDYDIIALLSIEDSQQLTEFVMETLRKVEGVVDTKTTLIRK